jgi:DNA modification methylase
MGAPGRGGEEKLTTGEQESTRMGRVIEEIDPSTLVPYARNARQHSPAQVAQIAGSIREFGFNAPVLIDDQNTIIAGHGRVLAAIQLGLDAVPCLRLSHLTETQRRAYTLADNRIALSSTWNEAMLALEFAELQIEDVDLTVAGFTEAEIAALTAEGTPTGLTDPDDVPDVPGEPVTVLGDVWILGKHRLVCGDCTDADTVDKALNGVRPHLMVTDPPYGVEYDADWRNTASRADGSPIGASAVGKVANDDRADWREAWSLFPGDVGYIWHAGVHAGTVADSLIACGFALRSQIIWAKSTFAIGRGDYHWQHEPCWYAVRTKGKGHYCGDRKQTTLWKIDKPQKSETGHSTQKPVECMRRPIENNSSPGQAVYEPFSGSGTTIIACEMTGRACHAIELNPIYVDVAIRRWQEFTGKVAVREADGQPFPSGGGADG